MTQIEDVIWAEFDWFAVDGEGAVACFSSAGRGAVPKVVLENVIPELGITSFFESYAVPTSDYIQLLSEGKLDDWIHLAQRGVYAYDYDDSRKIYVLIAYPTTPRTINSFDEQIARYLRVVTFEGLSFRDYLRFSPESHTAC